MNAVPILDPGGAELRVCGGPLRCHLLVTFRAGGCIDRTEFGRNGTRFGLFTDAPWTARVRWQ
jgi:hypothetical protein